MNDRSHSRMIVHSNTIKMDKFVKLIFRHNLLIIYKLDSIIFLCHELA